MIEQRGRLTVTVNEVKRIVNVVSDVEKHHDNAVASDSLLARMRSRWNVDSERTESENLELKLLQQKHVGCDED